jgi:16S rRNA pseudouridine516 synthase
VKGARLDRLVAERAGISRADATRLCRGGRVAVDGVPLRDGATHVAPGAIVTLDGRALDARGPLTLLLHKPTGCVSATTDALHPTVLDLVPAELRRTGLAPAGRLDKDTTGLLLLTDDGALNHRLTHPRRHVPKTYDATLTAPLCEQAAELVRDGMRLGDGTQLAPGLLRPLGPGPDGSPRVRVIIREGQYHQVRRMVAALGSHVASLARVAIGGLWLPDGLTPGACRPITEGELAAALTVPEVWREAGLDA